MYGQVDELGFDNVILHIHLLPTMVEVSLGLRTLLVLLCYPSIADLLLAHLVNQLNLLLSMTQYLLKQVTIRT